MFYLSACVNCFLFRMSFPLPSTSRLFSLSFLSGSLYLFLCISLCTVWRWVLYMVVSMGLCGFLHMFSSALTSTLWRCCFFIQCAFLAFLLKFKCSKVFGFISGFISYFRLTDLQVCFMQTSCFLIETRIQIAWLIKIQKDIIKKILPIKNNSLLNLCEVCKYHFTQISSYSKKQTNKNLHLSTYYFIFLSWNLLTGKMFISYFLLEIDI